MASAFQSGAFQSSGFQSTPSAHLVAKPVSTTSSFNAQIKTIISTGSMVYIPAGNYSSFNVQIRSIISGASYVQLPLSAKQSVNLLNINLVGTCSIVAKPLSIKTGVLIQNASYSGIGKYVLAPKSIANVVEPNRVGYIGAVGAVVVALNNQNYGLQTFSNACAVMVPKTSFSTGVASLSSVVCKPNSSFLYKRFTDGVSATFDVSTTPVNMGYLQASNDLNYIFSTDNSGLMRSSDYGETWQYILPSSTMTASHYGVSGDGMTIVVHDYATVLISKDYGETWTKAFHISDLPVAGWMYVVAVSEFGDSIIIATGNNYFIVSNDWGITWELAIVDLPECVYAENQKISASGQYVVFFDWEGNIFLSDDYCTSWSRIPYPFASEVTWIDALNMSGDGQKLLFYGGGYFNGVYSDCLLYSDDFGTTWDIQLAVDVASGCDGFKEVTMAADGTVIVSGYSGVDWDYPILLVFSAGISRWSTIQTDYEIEDLLPNKNGTEMVAEFYQSYPSTFGAVTFSKIGTSGMAALMPTAFKRKASGINGEKANVTVLQPFGITANKIGLLNYGISFYDNFESILDIGLFAQKTTTDVIDIAGSNNGVAVSTASQLELAAPIISSTTQVVEISNFGYGMSTNQSVWLSVNDEQYYNLSAAIEVGGAANNHCNASVVSVDGLLNAVNSAHVIDMGISQGTKFVSAPLSLTNATNITAPYDIQILIDGVDVTSIVESCTIESTESAVYDTILLTLPNGKQWNINDSPDMIKVIFPDKEYEFKVEEFSGVGVKRELWGRPLTAIYSEPWSTSSVWNEQNVAAYTAKELAEEILGSTVNWLVNDWVLPPKFEVSGTPVEAVQQIADAAGGIAVGDASSSVLTVRPKWPVRKVDMSIPQILIERETSIADIVVEKSEITSYGSVIVNGWSTEDILPDFEVEDDPTLGSDAFVRLYWRGPDHPVFTSTWITDGSAVYIETITETVTEVLVFEDGAASTQYPVWNFIEFEWLGNDYGDINWLENGYSNSLESANSDYGVAKCTYTTTYERWQLSNQAVETVQFGITVSQGVVSAEVSLTSGGVSAGEVIVPLLGDEASCVQYGTAYLDDSRVVKNVRTTVPRLAHIDKGVVVQVEDELLGFVDFGKLKAVTTRIEAGKIVQELEVLV